MQTQPAPHLFLPRDAMRQYGLYCRPVVCLSVRLSVTLVYCIQTAEDTVELLSRPGSPITLVFFDSERRYPVPSLHEAYTL